MTTAAMAEQVRALRSESAPGIRLLAGLRSLEVENAYVRLWSNRSGLAASANLAYEWVRRAGLDGIALTNLVVGRHTVDVYVNFLKVSSLAVIRRLGVPRDQTCVSMSLAVMRFLLYDRPRRLGQVCHNYFPEAYSMHCREWTEIRYERGAVANTALAHRRAMAVAEIMDSFDNETTLAHKVAALVRNSGIPCVAVYNVELDDATGICESVTPYSRLTAVATALRGTTLTKRTTAKPKSTLRKAIEAVNGTEPSETTVGRHRHKVRRRVLVAVKKRRH
ncbi:uncharacterized protein LOC119452720 [Dermacentor silvarum]|uniref:uncharacterized protein LOC119452720 n=1 Tax=Dermacentor silvarum TaxID=543639 RepID=UPI002101128D|nr:uncharacterized protein LOC119452720 [Dermacentor silvarum]